MSCAWWIWAFHLGVAVDRFKIWEGNSIAGAFGEELC